jgi:hypothetical protein
MRSTASLAGQARERVAEGPHVMPRVATGSGWATRYVSRKPARTIARVTGHGIG